MKDSKQTKPWWLSEPLSIVMLGGSIIDYADIVGVGPDGAKGLPWDPEALAQSAKRANATASHLCPMSGHVDGRTLLYAHKSPGDPQPGFDYLAQLVEHHKSAGVRTVIYYNVHDVAPVFGRQHPDWICKRIDGSPKDDVYSGDPTFCLNGPWRDWAFDRLRELCSYPIDGIFYDGPVIFHDCCYCDYCRKQFEARFGCPMPPKSDIHHPDFAKLVEFQSDSLVAFMRESRDAIKSIRTDILFYMNSSGMGPTRVTGRDNRILAQYQDILASEGGFFYGDLMGTPLFKAGMGAKLLEAEASAAGIPTLVFDCMAHKPWTYAFMLPAVESKLMWASSVANGAGTWLASAVASDDEQTTATIAPLYEFAKRHRADLFETRSLAEIAIMVSKPTLNYYRGADVPLTDFTDAARGRSVGNVTQEIQGWYRALWSMQIPFDLVDDYNVENDDLSRYRMIVLPNAACMSRGVCAALDGFVRKGGVLVGTFETAAYDEFGQRTAGGGLGETFGVAFADSKAEGPRRWDYFFPHDRGPWLEGIELPYVPSPTYALNVKTLASAEAPLTFSEAQACRYGGVLPQDTNRPAMVVNRVADGTAIYFACDFGTALGEWRLVEHLRIVRNIVDHCAASPLRISNAPPSVEVSLRRRRDGQCVLLHLVNYTGGMHRPITRVVPLRDMQVQLRLEGKAAKVEALWANQPLEWSQKDGQVRFTVPELAECETIRITLG